MRRSTRGWLVGVAALALSTSIVLTTRLAHAQTGGTTGTVNGTLSPDDVFIGVQRVQGENLNDVNRARFLNNASCTCKRPAWIKAVLNTSAIAKSALVPQTDVVSMYLGTSCDQPTLLGFCHKLGQTVMSDFRANGMLVPTTVDVLATNFSINAGANTVVGTGGVGGAGGAGGTSDTGGTGGTTTTTTTSNNPCDGLGDMFGQTIWLFIESSPGLHDALSKQYGVVIDAAPPPVPKGVTVAAANEALITGWTAIDKTTTTDLAGYQIFCARRGNEQVFVNGTFTTYVDSCGNDPKDSPQLPVDVSETALQDRNTNFICSDLLSVADTSFRIKILENAIPYAVGVAAVDSHGNASKMTEFASSPVETLDFYHQYRNGDPQGTATGGACAVAGRVTDTDAAGGVGLMLLGLFGARRRRRARKDLP
ncbi:MAG TPA: hypothetical protein VHU40_09110 [Polyangia bacterium]|nr:hypothetical protein [Polyangia bacterium]